MAGISKRQAVKILTEGGILAFPTDTVNGMGALYDNDFGIRKIFEIKNRDKEKPFALFFSSKRMLFNFFEMTPLLEKIVDEFLPGPLTVIAKPLEKLNPLLTRKKCVSFRIPDNKSIIEIIESLRKPLAVTSLNISGKEAIEDISDMRRCFPDLDVYGKLKQGGIPSTVVMLTKNKLSVIREGAIKESEFFIRLKILK